MHEDEHTADTADAAEGGTGAPPPVNRRNRVHGRSREYRNDAIAVQWHAGRCIHSGACIAALPGAFGPTRRPWIELDGHGAEDIVRAVEACPTSALTYTRRDGGPEEQAPAGTTIRAVRNGPLFVRGKLRVEDSAGTVLREGTRLAFCRCGRSGHMPFCDNTHRDTGFREP